MDGVWTDRCDEPLIIYFQQSKLQNDNTTCLELHDSKGDTMY